MYFITAMTQEKIVNIGRFYNGVSSIPGAHSRTFGFFITEERAKNAVSNNEMGLHETLYDFLVVEQIDEGIYEPTTSQLWYEWIDDKWEECNAPDAVNRYCSLGDGRFVSFAHVG
jgi:hypothetical protein